MRAKTNLLVAVLFAVFPILAFADAPDFLDSITDQITALMISTGVVAVVLEFIFRLIPTKEPLSWAWLVSRTLRAISRLTDAVATFLDKVLPQQTKKN